MSRILLGILQIEGADRVRRAILGQGPGASPGSPVVWSAGSRLGAWLLCAAAAGRRGNGRKSPPRAWREYENLRFSRDAALHAAPVIVPRSLRGLIGSRIGVLYRSLASGNSITDGRNVAGGPANVKSLSPKALPSLPPLPPRIQPTADGNAHRIGTRAHSRHGSGSLHLPPRRSITPSRCARLRLAARAPNSPWRRVMKLEQALKSGVVILGLLAGAGAGLLLGGCSSAPRMTAVSDEFEPPTRWRPSARPCAWNSCPPADTSASPPATCSARPSSPTTSKLSVPTAAGNTPAARLVDRHQPGYARLAHCGFRPRCSRYASIFGSRPR